MNRKNTAASKKDGGSDVRGLKSRHEPGTRMSVLLSNPDYLLEGFTEKRCQFLGKIDDIPTSTKMSDRGYLLAALDEKRNLGRLPWGLGTDHNVTVTLSAYNIKIIKDDRTGSIRILHRIPIHEIASISYINDDDQHLLFLKAGDARQQYCPCYILVCPKQADAEEVCTILQQAFQLVYTEATMEHLNESISAGERGSRASRTSMLLSSQQVSPTHRAKPSRAEAAVPEDSKSEEDYDIDETELAASSHNLSGEGLTAEELVQRYMERLHKLLDINELREFAALLKRYRDDLPVGKFLGKLSVLYGSQRQFLIPDMLSFIPEEDREEFDQFLQDNNLPSSTVGKKQELPSSPTIPHSPPPPPVMAAQLPQPPPVMPPPPTSSPPSSQSAKEARAKRKHAKSRHHHDSHVADVDQFIQDIDSQMDSILHTTDF